MARPNGSKTYTSKDGAFVLVIAANGSNGEPGGDAQAEDKEARLVMAVAGDGGPAGGRNRGGNGGKASARAEGGVAVAVGGRGGDGGGGGGGGGSTKVEGKVGGIGLGGPGGSGIGWEVEMSPVFCDRRMRHALLATTFAVMAVALLPSAVGCNRSGPATGIWGRRRRRQQRDCRGRHSSGQRRAGKEVGTPAEPLYGL